MPLTSVGESGTLPKKRAVNREMDILNTVVSRATQDARSLAVASGLTTVAITHATMIVSFSTPTPAQRTTHALINLGAVGSILWGLRIL